MDDLQEYFSQGPRTATDFVRWMAVFLPSMEGMNIKFKIEFLFNGEDRVQFSISFSKEGDMHKIAERIEAANVAMAQGVQ